ncbi:3-ketosteroid-delta-1-dehydrogenase [Sphingobacterium griseoflavum]|uniref:3-ketosteroid 1-dehydrogenase or fumarate reductase/succinate dehydrogenase n=1 Tax=Sphingobacterium griseoflavum TaxID=1474952 RepID=A0ABQ3HVE9_9SPHI|nr:3-ketosteroid-delta-1-dehydrogenase [Sphingobacterium griseoflavum]GHE29836.1 putative 3-ketosteroid 1-dehydrogenase or fumarate reductase/succinate dehydrogenase [Sphingobacterium griseoflavum]
MSNSKHHKKKEQDTTIEVDLLIVGAGTGMAAALAAHELGLSTWVIEKTSYVGGSTAISGGAFWIPDNAVLQEAGSSDSLQGAQTYLHAIVDDQKSTDRIDQFLKYGHRTVDMLRRMTPMQFFWSKGYPDYHPEMPGGSAEGRTCECKPFNVRMLGRDVARLRPAQLKPPVPMPVTGFDYKWFNLMVCKPFKAMPLFVKRMLQGIGGLLLGKHMVGGGQAIAGGLFAGLKRADIPVWTNCSLMELIVNKGRVEECIVKYQNEEVRITAKRGIVLSTGGFDHNMLMRHHYQSSGLGDHYSLGSDGNTGDGINLARSLCAGIDNMEEAWWFPAIAPPEDGGRPQVLLAERSLPGSFMVNHAGKRFINEATDYMTFGQKILALEKEGQHKLEMWLIFDQSYRNRYILSGTIFPMMALPKNWYESGVAYSADTAEALASQLGLPMEQFVSTFQRFNELSMTGKDTDFHRGESVYDNYYGDPTIMPNPNLRPLRGKLYAVKVVLADLGTCGGLVTDKFAQVLREDGMPIRGLYAVGNSAANVFGRVYPGAGATIGQGLVFSYVAAHHAAEKLE